MHIPTSMLNGAICPVTAAVSAVGVGLAVAAARKSEDKPSAAQFAGTTAMIFALQMLNYPVMHGTSGHLLGSALAVSLLGVPFAVLAMSIVLIVQCVFFADGGITALGANILNMSLIGVGVAGFIMKRFSSKMSGLMVASFASVVLAAAACSLELAVSGTSALTKVFSAMVSVHTLIGLGEGLLSVGVVFLINRCRQRWQSTEDVFAVSSIGMALVAAMLSPFASGSPDGLEWVGLKLSFAEFSGFELQSLFPDYQVALFSHEGLATIAAGIIGVALVFGITFVLGKVLDNQMVPAIVKK